MHYDGRQESIKKEYIIIYECRCDEVLDGLGTCLDAGLNRMMGGAA